MKIGWYLMSLAVLLGILFGLIGCGETTPKPQITSSIKQEIYAIGQDEAVNRYIEIREVEDKQGYLYVGINIKYDPEIITNLEDAYVQAQVYTNAIAKDTVKILNKYNINQDVSVWAQLPLGDGEVALLGNTWYSAQSNSYTFKRYKP